MSNITRQSFFNITKDTGRLTLKSVPNSVLICRNTDLNEKNGQKS